MPASVWLEQLRLPLGWRLQHRWSLWLALPRCPPEPCFVLNFGSQQVLGLARCPPATAHSERWGCWERAQAWNPSHRKRRPEAWNSAAEPPGRFAIGDWGPTEARLLPPRAQPLKLPCKPLPAAITNRLRFSSELSPDLPSRNGWPIAVLAVCLVQPGTIEPSSPLREGETTAFLLRAHRIPNFAAPPFHQSIGGTPFRLPIVIAKRTELQPPRIPLTKMPTRLAPPETDETLSTPRRSCHRFRTCGSRPSSPAMSAPGPA